MGEYTAKSHYYEPTLKFKVERLLDTLDTLIEATYTRKRLPLLQKANVQLEKLRYLIRICHDFKLLSSKQYAYISNEINEVGKLVGGWIRSQSGSS